MEKWRETLVAIAGILVVVLQIINALLSSGIERTVSADHVTIETMGRTIASDHEVILAARADQKALRDQVQELMKARQETK